MIKKTFTEKQELKLARAKYKAAIANPSTQFLQGLREVLDAFRRAHLPKWGSLVIQGNRV